SADGRVTTLSGPEFRAALDPERMKSNKVSRFAVDGGQLHIEGTGYGHGVGVRQEDALAMARAGKAAEEIVQTFYKGVTIERRGRGGMARKGGAYRWKGGREEGGPWLRTGPTRACGDAMRCT